MIQTILDRDVSRYTRLKRIASLIMISIASCGVALVPEMSRAQEGARAVNQDVQGERAEPKISTKPTFELSGEVFGGWTRSSALEQTFQAFELERAELGVQSPQGALWGGELRLESVRSAGRDSLMGIDGDSLLLRVKRAWAFGSTRRGSWSAQGRVGLIHDSWHELVMSAYPLRAVGPAQGEREGFQETSDLGASLSLGWRRHRLFASLTNGEGRRYQEQNRGKDLLVGVLLSEPLSSPQSAINVSFAYRDGSRGAGSGQNHRLYGAGWLMGPKLQMGLIGAYAWGLNDRPTLSASAAQGWVSYVAHPTWATLFLSGEWLRYEPSDVNVISAPDHSAHSSTDLSADPNAAPSIHSESTSQDRLDRSATRWSGGVSQLIHASPQRGSLTSSSVVIRVFERIEYQGASDLKSPVFGVPQLASEWRASLMFSLSWGAPPPSALATPAAQLSL